MHAMEVGGRGRMRRTLPASASTAGVRRAALSCAAHYHRVLRCRVDGCLRRGTDVNTQARYGNGGRLRSKAVDVQVSAVSVERAEPRVVHFDEPAPGDDGGEGRELDELQVGPAAKAAQFSGSSTPSRRRKRRRIKNEKMTYLLSAVAFSVGVTGLAFVCTYSRFTRHLAPGDPLPWGEIGSTLLFIAGAAFAMELWALWAHRALWHETPLLWKLHRSHHEPRVGPFEANDVFAIVNAAPAIGLIAYGFFNDGYVPGLCYGAGLGITVFGMLYMFVHDGLVHKRFSVGPIGEVPYLKRVAAAHKVHHGERFEGVPYGLFLGPWELEKLPGGSEEIERILQQQERGKGEKTADIGKLEQ